MNPTAILQRLQTKIVDLLRDASQKKASIKKCGSNTRHAFFDGKMHALREVEKELGFLVADAEKVSTGNGDLSGALDCRLAIATKLYARARGISHDEASDNINDAFLNQLEAGHISTGNQHPIFITLAEVEDLVGHGSGGWDMVDPRKIVKAVLDVYHQKLAGTPAQ